MPLTPVHCGPATLLKALMPNYFSLSAFVFSQILMDLELVVNIIKGAPALPAFSHSYVGATVMLLLSLILAKPLCQLWLRLWNRLMAPGHHSRLYVHQIIPFKAVLIASVIGVYSHVAIDSIVYEIHPWWPWSQNNWLYGTLSEPGLYIVLIFLGTVGMFWLICWY